MIFVPINKIQALARAHGLKGTLQIVQKQSLSNGYNPFTGVIRLRPYRSRFHCALRLAHEIGHQIDLERWPALLVVLSYWPAIVGIGIYVGLTTSWWLSLPAVVMAYFLHPFEVWANCFAFKHWREYYALLK